jgi:hypothetical protein
LSTALRQTSTGFLFGWIFYLPLFVIGFPLEILVTVNAVNLIYQFWVHTQTIRRMGGLDYILVTPSNHRVHHAQNERYIDKNYGGMLILWDRMFGTFEDERDDEAVVFGLRKPLANWNPVWANLQVYDYLLFDALKTSRWRDKIGIWFRRTGWRPADVAAPYPKASSDLADFSKFDAHASPAMKRYVMAQFVVALAAVIVVGQMFAVAGARGVLIPCLMLWTQLWTIGLLNEGRTYAVRMEMVRLLIVVPGGAAIMPATDWTIVLSYAGLSLLWLWVADKNLLKQQVIDTN